MFKDVFSEVVTYSTRELRKFWWSYLLPFIWLYRNSVIWGRGYINLIHMYFYTPFWLGISKWEQHVYLAFVFLRDFFIHLDGLKIHLISNETCLLLGDSFPSFVRISNLNIPSTNFFKRYQDRLDRSINIYIVSSMDYGFISTYQSNFQC